MIEEMVNKIWLMVGWLMVEGGRWKVGGGGWEVEGRWERWRVDGGRWSRRSKVASHKSGVEGRKSQVESEGCAVGLGGLTTVREDILSSPRSGGKFK
jgi:hypothetical protein